MYTMKTPVDAALQLDTFTSTVGINHPLKSARAFATKTRTVKDMTIKDIKVLGMGISIAIQLQFLTVNQAAKNKVLVKLVTWVVLV